MAVQPTDPSIINFLTSRGFRPSGGERAPLFTQRKGIFESLGLGPEFRGESNQNLSLLRALSTLEREKGIQLNPTNLPDFIKSVSSTTDTVPPAPTGTTPTSAPEPTKVPDYLSSLARQAIQQDQTPSLPSADEAAKLALEKVTGSATFPLQREAAEAEKAETRLAGQQQGEKFIRDIASRGLIFSGAKTQGVSAIEADTLAKTLNIDRRFALLVATGLQSAAQDIVKQAKKEIEDSKKEGKEARTEARDALKALGYVIDPGTGTLVRTAAETRAEAADIRAEQTQLRAERSLELSEERLALSEDAARRAEASMAFSQQMQLAHLQLSIEAGNRAQATLDRALNGTLTEEEKNKGTGALNIPRSDFDNLSAGDQAWAVANEGQIKSAKERIESMIDDGTKRAEIERMVDALNYPGPVKDTLIRYESIYRRGTK